MVPIYLDNVSLTPTSPSTDLQRHVPAPAQVEGEVPAATAGPDPANVSTMTAPLTSAPSPEISSSIEEQSVHTEKPVELSPAQNLWDEAYRSLAEDKETSELVKGYVKVLVAHLGDGSLSREVDDNEPTSLEVVDEPAWAKDPVLREQKMRELLLAGKSKVATVAKVGQWVDNASGFLASAKTIIDFAVENIPQAALPWAGVCIGLQVREAAAP